MQIKLLHLNIEGGRVFERVIDFIKQEDFDIVQLQEVTGGSFSKSGFDNFSEIKNRLGYQGELAVAKRMKGHPESYFGNATFFKPGLSYLKKEVVWLKEYAEVETYNIEDKDAIRQFPRNGLALLFDFSFSPIWFINAHLAWGPDQYDEPHKVEQGKILYNFLKSLQEPFVLSADFNVDKNSEIVKSINTLAVNHAVQAGVTNTLNPHLHRASHLFPPGLGVDFLYTSPSLKASDFQLIETPDLSDHLGLRITVEV